MRTKTSDRNTSAPMHERAVRAGIRPRSFRRLGSFGPLRRRGGPVYERGVGTRSRALYGRFRTGGRRSCLRSGRTMYRGRRRMMDDGSRRRRPMVVIRLRNAADQQQTAQYDGEHSHENLLNVSFSDARRPQRKEGLHKRRSKNFPLNRASENTLRRAHAAPFRKRYVFFPQGPSRAPPLRKSPSAEGRRLSDVRNLAPPRSGVCGRRGHGRRGVVAGASVMTMGMMPSAARQSEGRTQHGDQTKTIHGISFLFRVLRPPEGGRGAQSSFRAVFQRHVAAVHTGHAPGYGKSESRTAGTAVA